MREPERIDRILEKLRIIWQAIPHLQFNHIKDSEFEKKLDKVLLEMETGVAGPDGEIYYLDRCWLVTKGQLYED